MSNPVQIHLLIEESANLKGKKVGLIRIDEVDGFCKAGCGNLAPPEPDDTINKMIDLTNLLAKRFTAQGLPILAFLDTHEPGLPEEPYPAHCEKGTGEENLVDMLTWLNGDKNTTIIRKDCLNGFIGAIREDGTNAFVEWMERNYITDLVVVGICTDICVMQFVQSVLAARNHMILYKLRNVYVYTPACATYNLPEEKAVLAGLPQTAAHPRDLTHTMGLYFMQMSGAILTKEVNI